MMNHITFLNYIYLILFVTAVANFKKYSFIPFLEEFFYFL